MMKIEIKGKKLKENVGYHGVISRYRQTESKLTIFVTFNKDPETEYIKSITIDSNINSAFAKMAEALDLFDADGDIETDYLDDLHVIANLQKGYDDRLYIDRIIVDEKFYAALEDTEENETEKIENNYEEEDDE